jgi:hypothetical protein
VTCQNSIRRWLFLRVHLLKGDLKVTRTFLSSLGTSRVVFPLRSLPSRSLCSSFQAIRFLLLLRFLHGFVICGLFPAHIILISPIIRLIRVLLTLRRFFVMLVDLWSLGVLSLEYFVGRVFDCILCTVIRVVFLI